MPAYVKLIPPVTGEKISRKGTTLTVPDHPVIPFIEGDGTGDRKSTRLNSSH